MKKFTLRVALTLAAAASLIAAIPVFAWESTYLTPKTTVRPQHYGANPGSIYNPYIVTSPSGEKTEIYSRTPDFVPNDGSLDAGTLANPYEVHAPGDRTLSPFD